MRKLRPPDRPHEPARGDTSLTLSKIYSQFIAVSGIIYWTVLDAASILSVVSVVLHWFLRTDGDSRSDLAVGNPCRVHVPPAGTELPRPQVLGVVPLEPARDRRRGAEARLPLVVPAHARRELRPPTGVPDRQEAGSDRAASPASIGRSACTVVAAACRATESGSWDGR